MNTRTPTTLSTYTDATNRRDAAEVENLARAISSAFGDEMAPHLLVRLTSAMLIRRGLDRLAEALEAQEVSPR